MCWQPAASRRKTVPNPVVYSVSSHPPSVSLICSFNSPPLWFRPDVFCVRWVQFCLFKHCLFFVALFWRVFRLHYRLSLCEKLNSDKVMIHIMWEDCLTYYTVIWNSGASILNSSYTPSQWAHWSWVSARACLCVWGSFLHRGSRLKDFLRGELLTRWKGSQGETGDTESFMEELL